jgi:hypothetical protein
MSILDSIKNQLGIQPIANVFYLDCRIEKVEWWLSWCHEYPNLFWARLRIFSNGKADVLFQDENKTYGFENEEFAGYFISQDEFSKFENIDEEDRNGLEIPEDALIEIPDWENKEVENFEYIGKY